MELIAPSHWLTWLKPDTRFKVKIEETGKVYAAKVVRLGGRVDPVSQSIKVKAQIAGHYPELLAGMSGVVSFPATAQ